MFRGAYDFRTCNDTLHAIMNGTLTVKGVSNVTLAASGWIWDGPIGGLKSSFPRQLITAITYQGCVELCGNITQLNSPETVLNIISTWIFPLSILFSLPYESPSGNGSQGVFSTVSAWLGSPQTSLTAIIFNFDQIRLCHQQAKGRPRWFATYYVLSCFNQFRLPTADEDEIFMKTIIYGLFRPLSPTNREEENIDIEYTRQLLEDLARQLRILRRRAVVPMLLSLLSFLAAFIFSVVLAFAEVDADLDVTPLTIGLLYSWLPLLVVYSIMDRNPVSPDRTAELMSRWLYNVNEVRKWKSHRERPKRVPEDAWWKSTDDLPNEFRVGDFIGQGRGMEYCGFVHAVVSTVPQPHRIDDKNDLEQYDKKAYAVRGRLSGRRPGLWWFTALCAESLVCTQIMMAVLIAITSPTVGIGCWSGSFLMYGTLTSVSWVFGLFQRSCGPWARRFCHTANMTALVFLVFVTGLILSGALNNCICNTSWPAHSLNGGYMIFEEFDFIRDNFNVILPWVIACVVGFLVVAVVLFWSFFWWLKCEYLSAAQERDAPIAMNDLGISIGGDWLR